MSSAFMRSGSHQSPAAGTRSWYQWSRPSLQPISCSVRRTTSTCSIDGQSASASSAACLSGTMPPLRQPPSAVISTLHSASLMRPASDCAEKPPKTTECAAPMRAQASSAIGSSGTMPR